MVCDSSVSQPPTASKARQVKRGVKEVAKAIRKGERGCVNPNFLSVEETARR